MASLALEERSLRVTESGLFKSPPDRRYGCKSRPLRHLTSFTKEKTVLHLRFEGRSYDIPREQLTLAHALTDRQVLDRVARHLDVGPERLRHYVVDRRPSGVVMVRPEAVYG